jgi:hypothetical protein
MATRRLAANTGSSGPLGIIDAAQRLPLDKSSTGKSSACWAASRYSVLTNTVGMTLEQSGRAAVQPIRAAELSSCDCADQTIQGQVAG